MLQTCPISAAVYANPPNGEFFPEETKPSNLALTPSLFPSLRVRHAPFDAERNGMEISFAL